MYANCNWASIPGPLFLKRGGVGIEAQLLFLFDIEAVLLTQFVIEMFKKITSAIFSPSSLKKCRSYFFYTYLVVFLFLVAVLRVVARFESTFLVGCSSSRGTTSASGASSFS